MYEEGSDVECDLLSALDVTVDNVVQVLLGREEEMQKFTGLKLNLESEIEEEQVNLLEIQFEVSELEDQLTTLKLRNASYQREQTNLRNAITIVRFQIEKIKAHIEKEKTKAVENLEKFEKAVDEVTEKFRSGPDDYAREGLSAKIREEKEAKNELAWEMEKLTDSYLDALRERGLKVGRKEGEEMIDYVEPGSELFSLVEITKNLNLITYEVQKLIGERN